MSAVIFTLNDGVERLRETELVRQLGEAGYTKRLLISLIYMAQKPTRKYLVIGQTNDIQELLTSVSCQKLDFTIEQYNYSKRQLDNTINGVQVSYERWLSDGQAKAVAHNHIARLVKIIPSWKDLFFYSAYPTNPRTSKDNVEDKPKSSVKCFKFVIYPKIEDPEFMSQVLTLLYDYFSNIVSGKPSVHFNKKK